MDNKFDLRLWRKKNIQPILMYILIVLLWGALTTICGYIIVEIVEHDIKVIQKVFGIIFISLFLLITLAFTPPLVLNLADIFIGMFSRLFLYKKLNKISKGTVLPEKAPVVAIVFPVMNDFMPDQILQSATQTYQHIKKYILDDSTNLEVVNQIDEFAKKHNFVVLRKGDWRKDYYKKGCGLSSAFDYFINNSKGEWDVMCHCDSGDILHSRYIEKNLPLFYGIKNLGVLTGTYASFNYGSLFQNIVGKIHDDILTDMFLNKTMYTNFMMPGAGTMYPAEAIYSLENGWPNNPCEDGSISLQLIQKGYNTLWSNLVFNAEMNTLDLMGDNKRNARIYKGILQQNRDKFYDMKKYNGFTEKVSVATLKSVCFLPIMLLSSILLPLTVLVIQSADLQVMFNFLYIILLILGSGTYAWLFYYFLFELFKNKKFWQPLAAIILFTPYVTCLMVINFISCIQYYFFSKGFKTFTITNKNANVSVNKKIWKKMFFHILLEAIIAASIGCTYFLCDPLITRNSVISILSIPLTFSFSFLIWHFISLFKRKTKDDFKFKSCWEIEDKDIH